MQRSWLGLVLTLVVSVLLGPRAARADQPGAHTIAVAVLAFDSEDAEQQADALSGALRSRVRSAQGWSLVDTTQSLGMLTAALRCPSRPPPDCQQKIAEQVKVERYIWGFVAKGPVGQVTAEIHFYQKGKPDTVIKESYADNLTDPNDDKGVGKVAAHVLERLGGSAIGVVVVRAGDASGEVIVDGDKRLPLAAGQARIELGAGGHSIEVSSPGAPRAKRNVLVTAGKETVVEIEVAAPPGAAESSKPFPTRKVLAGATVGVGAVLAVIAFVDLAGYLDAQKKSNDLDAYKSFLPSPNGSDKSSAQLSCESKANAAQQEACNLDNHARNASRGALIFGGAAVVLVGAGVYLWLSDSGSSEKSASAKTATPARPKTRIAPAFGARTGGLVVSGAF